MTSKMIPVITLALGGILTMPTQAAHSATTKNNFSSPQVREIETIVENYFDRNPEKIEEILKKSLAKKEEQQQKRMQKSIVKYQEQIFNDPTSPVGGNANGEISIAVFMDPYCGYCRRFQNILTEVQKKRDDLRVVYKILPILGTESGKAAREEIAAGMQGKFFDFHDALYESAARDHNARMDLAKENGIDVKRLKQDLKSANVRQAMKNNQSLAEALEIQATPAFIINNTMIMGLVDAENLNKLIDAEKEAQKKPTTES